MTTPSREEEIEKRLQVGTLEGLSAIPIYGSKYVMGGLRYLLARVRELEAANGRMADALRFYAPSTSYENRGRDMHDIQRDRGNVARIALGGNTTDYVWLSATKVEE